MERIGWIDIVRGAAFLMVIFDHLDFDNVIVMRYFSPIYLTSFFFVSGYLYKDNSSFFEMLEHRTRTLLLPFILLGSLMIVFSYFFSLTEKQIGITDAFVELFMQYGESHINNMWFVPSLYVYSIVFFFLLKISKNKYSLELLSILCFIANWLYIYCFDGVSLPWHLHVTGFACFYMFLGCIYKRREKLFARFNNKKFLLIGIPLYFVTVTFCFEYCNSCISFWGSPFFFDALIITTLGIGVVICVGRNNKSVLLNYVGANTLLYFAVHGKAMSLVNYLYEVSLKASLDSFFINNVFFNESVLIIKTICCAVLIIPFAMIINRYFPKLIGHGFKLW
jgi:fucose 4-O-acetylase-like acetyltransferase